MNCPHCDSDKLKAILSPDGWNCFKCSSCHKTYVTTFSANRKGNSRPKKLKLFEYTAEVACPGCGTVWVRKDGLNNGVQNYECTQCDRKFIYGERIQSNGIINKKLSKTKHLNPNTAKSRYLRARNEALGIKETQMRLPVQLLELACYPNRTKQEAVSDAIAAYNEHTILPVKIASEEQLVSVRLTKEESLKLKTTREINPKFTTTKTVIVSALHELVNKVQSLAITTSHGN